MAKSEWKVQCNYIAGVGKMYRPYRVRDISQPVHSGNIEVYGDGRYCEERDAVQETVDMLNEQEGRK